MKKRINNDDDLLQSLDYDKSSNTISDLRGGRIKINISDENKNTELVNNGLAHKSELKRIKKLEQQIQDAKETQKYKDVAIYRGKLNQLVNNINQRKQDPYSDTILKKSDYIKTNKDDIKDSPTSIKHEIGHKNTIDKRRNYVKQTGGINPDTGKKYPNKEITNENKTPRRIIRKICLSPNELQDLKKSNFNLYKKYMKTTSSSEREEIARNIKEKNLDPKIKSYIDSERQSKKSTGISFNRHDGQIDELQADAFSIHHTKKNPEDMFKNSLKNYQQKRNNDIFDSRSHDIDRNQRYQNAKKIHEQTDSKAYEKVIEELFYKYHIGIYTTETTLKIFDLIYEKYLK